MLRKGNNFIPLVLNHSIVQLCSGFLLVERSLRIVLSKCLASFGYFVNYRLNSSSTLSSSSSSSSSIQIQYDLIVVETDINNNRNNKNNNNNMSSIILTTLPSQRKGVGKKENQFEILYRVSAATFQYYAAEDGPDFVIKLLRFIYFSAIGR